VRKLNPTAVRTDFDSAIATQELFYTRLRPLALSASDRKQLAEQVFFGAACLWEGFVSDLLVAYCNTDSTALIANRTAEVSALVQKKLGATVANHVRTTFPNHLKASTVVAILDVRGYNVTFPTCESLVDTAKDLLVAAHQTGFVGLSTSDKAAVDAWISVRNCLAHRSKSSFGKMNLALQVATLKPAHTSLARGAHRISDIGSFLDARPTAAGPQRLLCFLAAMRSIASRL
jgi:hypothetical protein